MTQSFYQTLTQLQLNPASYTMKTLVSLLVMMAALLLTANAFPVNLLPLHVVGDSNDIVHTTAASDPERRISLNRFTAMVGQLVGALQVIWMIVKENVRKFYDYVELKYSLYCFHRRE